MSLNHLAGNTPFGVFLNKVVHHVAGFLGHGCFRQLESDPVQERANNLVADRAALLVLQFVLQITADAFAELVHTLGAITLGKSIIQRGQHASP